MNRRYLKWYSCSSKDGAEQKPHTKARIFQGFTDTNEKNNSKKYCGIRNQKVVVTGKKEEGDGLEMSLICFPIGVGMLFCCLSDAFNCHRCLSIVSTDHLSTYESLYFMLCITRLKGKDSSDSREVFQKERSPCGSLYTHCGICSPLTQYRAEVSF